MAKKKKKKKKTPETGMDRLKRFALWQWGLIVIFAGIFANLVVQYIPHQGTNARAEALGRGVATLSCVIVGIVMIIVHFVRSRRR